MMGELTWHAWTPADGPHLIESLRDRRVLLVEDNELNQLLARELLQIVAGMCVTVVGDGREALDRLRVARFDVVLMDVQMPGMDGYEATRRIRATPKLAGLPVIAMTANTSAGDCEECLACGMDDFIPKPFERAALLAVLAKWIGRMSGAADDALANPASAAGFAS
jgi:two-component system sensor histidine kinase/response regulator